MIAQIRAYENGRPFVNVVDPAMSY
jgi:hypothetical protein